MQECISKQLPNDCFVLFCKPAGKCTLHDQSDLWLSVAACAVLVVCYQKVVANRTSLLTVYLP